MDGILVDTTKCTGCEKCVVACIEKNHLNLEKSYYDRVTSRDGLSADRWLSINKVSEGHFTRLSCMHCVDPACVSACLVGAITKTSEGPVIYDTSKCIGCRYCMLACPFHTPRYEWNAIKPFMRKCNMCYDRLQRNELPACVAACPYEAIIFGERNELLNRARALIRSNPGKYLNHIWGEKEYGGTSVIYISEVDLAGMGWHNEPSTPIPDFTQPLIEKTPEIGLTVGSVLVGLTWIIRRRMKLTGHTDQSGDNDKMKEKVQEDVR